MNFTLQGSCPVAHIASNALMCMNDCPLSSSAPRPPDAAVAHDGFERLGRPLLARIDRHHVVMAVDQHRFGLGVDDLLGEDHRIPLGGHHLGVVGTGLDERRRQMFGTAHHIPAVFRLRADRRNAQHLEQLFDEGVAVRADVIENLFHNRMSFYRLQISRSSPMNRCASASASAIDRASV